MLTDAFKFSLQCCHSKAAALPVVMGSATFPDQSCITVNRSVLSIRRSEAKSMRYIQATAALVALFICPICIAGRPEVSTSCAFNDGKQFSIRYVPVSRDKKPKHGSIWLPGDTPMALLTETALAIGNTALAPGAYTLYLIPGEKTWTLIVNRNVTEPGKYDSTKDVVRFEMPTAQLGSPVDLKLTLAKMGPQQCNLRVYQGSVGTYGAEFKQVKPSVSPAAL
jgi:Protein of unknown function (DUF2911)